MNLNGISVKRVGTGTIRIPLPREAWREMDGGCVCRFCSADGKPVPAYWDTMAVSTRTGKKTAYDYTWTIHAPELQLGAKPLRPDTNDEDAWREESIG
jgi:hypothetical protein